MLHIVWMGYRVFGCDRGTVALISVLFKQDLKSNVRLLLSKMNGHVVSHGSRYNTFVGTKDAMSVR